MKMLKKATNRVAYAKVGLYGDAGSGKTFTAAKIAAGLHQFSGSKKPVGFFDTEPAASYIIPIFEKAGIEFFVYDESRALSDLMAFMDEAEKECSVVIIDSITHVWRDAQDSYLKKINSARSRQRKSPIYSLEFHHWKPIKSAWATFTDRYLSSKVHCIVCGRAGKIYEYQTNEEKGKMELISTGTRMATEKELGYEPSLLIEMVKHREGGRIINRALVEKDRTALLNGQEIDMPTFDQLKAHFEFLNIGGNHFDSMEQRDSQDLYTEEGDDSWGHEKRQREISCEEIKSLLITHGLDGAGKEEKKARNDLIVQIFGTGSWTQIESMPSEKIKAGLKEMRAHLEGKKDSATASESNPDLVNAILQALTDSVTEEEIEEAEDLIRELKNPEDKAKCEKALEHKRAVMAQSQPA